MAVPHDRASLKLYSMRKLGFPVINLNLDDDQLDDRIDEAVDLYQQFHFDATTKLYLNVTANADVMNISSNTYHKFKLPNTVIGVSRVFPMLGATTGSMGASDFNIFDLNYQIRLNELYDFTSADYVYFELAQQHIRTLEMLFIGEPPIRFNRHEGTLYIDLKWNEVGTNTKFVVETFSILPESNDRFWNDVWLKAYVTVLFKEQWASNIKKYKNVQLPGGVMLSGQDLYNEAIEEKKDLQEKLRNEFVVPPQFLMG